MANRTGFQVTSTIVTPQDTDKFPVVDMDDVKGGYHTVATVEDMNAIPVRRRSDGMLVYVTGDRETYRYSSFTASFNKEVTENGASSGTSGASGDVKKTVFSTLEQLLAAPLALNDVVSTHCYAVADDDGGATYRIVDKADADEWDPLLNNGLAAHLINRDRVTYSMFGAKLDGTTDDNNAITNAHLYGNKYKVRVENHHGIIYRKSKAWIYVHYDVDLRGSVLVMDDSNTAFYSWYCIGNLHDTSKEVNHPVSLSDKAKAALTEGSSYIDPHDLELPPNAVLKLSEDPFMYRDDYGSGYAVDRIDLMVHHDRGIFSGPLVWDWTNAGGRTVSSGYGQSSTTKFTATYSILPEHHLTFRGCEVRIKCSASTQVGLCQILRHRVTISDFTIIPSPETMLCTGFKASVFYGRWCYDVTFKNIQATNITGRDITGGSGHSGYLVDVNGGMSIKLEDCCFNGFWGSTCFDNVKDIHVTRCQMNRIDVHSYFRDMFINNCTLYNHGVQIGFGTGICSVHNCSFIFQKNVEQSHANGVISLNNSYGNFFRGLLNVDGIHINAQPDGSPVVLFFTEFLSGAGCCDPALTTVFPEIRARNVYALIDSPTDHLSLISFYGKPSGDGKIYNPHLMTFDNIVSSQGVIDWNWNVSISGCTTLNQDVNGSLATFQNVLGLQGTDEWCGSVKPTIRNYSAAATNGGSASGGTVVPDNVATKDDVTSIWNLVNKLQKSIDDVAVKTDSGVYYIESGSAGAYPTAKAGYLLNLPKANTDGSVTTAQLYMPEAGGAIYQRAKDDNSTWTDWVKLAADSSSSIAS